MGWHIPQAWDLHERRIFIEEAGTDRVIETLAHKIQRYLHRKRWNRKSVSKRWHTKFRHRGIIQKKHITLRTRLKFEIKNNSYNLFALLIYRQTFTPSF
jgi:hypothetical protein